jgi:hypothetical protein
MAKLKLAWGVVEIAPERQAQKLARQPADGRHRLAEPV